MGSIQNKSDIPAICIVHVEGLTYGSVRLLSGKPNFEEIFERIKHIRDQRLNQPIDYRYRMDKMCALVPSQLKSHHGYHRECYQRFTMDLQRLNSTENDHNPSTAILSVYELGSRDILKDAASSLNE